MKYLFASGHPRARRHHKACVTRVLSQPNSNDSKHIETPALGKPVAPRQDISVIENFCSRFYAWNIL